MAFGLPYLQYLEAFFHLVQETAVEQLDVEMVVEASVSDLLEGKAKELAHTTPGIASIVDHQKVVELERSLHRSQGNDQSAHVVVLGHLKRPANSPWYHWVCPQWQQAL